MILNGNEERSMANCAKNWFAQVKTNHAHAAVAQDAGSHEWACFAAQQAAEKALNAPHLFRGQKAWGRSDAEAEELSEFHGKTG